MEPESTALATSIATLNPALDELSKRHVHVVVTLVWPYSSSSRRISLLLADPDFRLRATNGQVKVHFLGCAAEELVNLKISIGDHLFLSLDGSKWEKQAAKVGILESSIDWELSYSDRLKLEVRRHSTFVASIDWREETLSQTEEKPPETPFSKPSTSQRSLLLSDWASPAFTKRLAEFTPRKESPSLPPTRNEPEDAEEDGYIHGIGRKRPKFGRPSGEWTFVEAPASPVASVKDLGEELELAASRLVEASDDLQEPTPPQPETTESNALQSEETPRSINVDVEAEGKSDGARTPSASPPLIPIGQRPGVSQEQYEGAGAEDTIQFTEPPPQQQPPTFIPLETASHEQLDSFSSETYNSLYLLSDAAQHNFSSLANPFGAITNSSTFNDVPLQQNLQSEAQVVNFSTYPEVRSTTPDGQPSQIARDIASQALQGPGEGFSGDIGGATPAFGIYRDHGAEDSGTEGDESDGAASQENYKEEDYYKYTTLKESDEDQEGDEEEGQEEQEGGSEIEEESSRRFEYDEGYDRYPNQAQRDREGDDDDDDDDNEEEPSGDYEYDEERGGYVMRRRHKEDEVFEEFSEGEEDEEDEELRREADAAARAPLRIQEPEIIDLDSTSDEEENNDDDDDDDEEEEEEEEDDEEDYEGDEEEEDGEDIDESINGIEGEPSSQKDEQSDSTDSSESRDKDGTSVGGFVNEAAPVQDDRVSQDHVQGPGDNLWPLISEPSNEAEYVKEVTSSTGQSVPQWDVEGAQAEKEPNEMEAVDVDSSSDEDEDESGFNDDAAANERNLDRAIEDVSKLPPPAASSGSLEKVTVTTEYVAASSGDTSPMVDSEAKVETIHDQAVTIVPKAGKVETEVKGKSAQDQEDIVEARTIEATTLKITTSNRSAPETKEVEEELAHETPPETVEEQETGKLQKDTAILSNDEFAVVTTGPTVEEPPLKLEDLKEGNLDNDTQASLTRNNLSYERTSEGGKIEQRDETSTDTPGEEQRKEEDEEEESFIARSPSPTMQLQQELFACSYMAETTPNWDDNDKSDTDGTQTGLLGERFTSKSIEANITRDFESSELHDTHISTEDETIFDSILDVDLPGPNPGAEGYRSRTSYYSPLSTLVNTFGAQVDAMAVVLEPGEIEETSQTPPFYHHFFEVTEPSMSGIAVPVQIVRSPSREALPSIRRGDVILLCDFTVRTADHRVMLMSSDISAWAVFNNPQGTVEDVQVNNRPVEFGAEELEFASRLREWFTNEGLSLAIKQTAKRQALQHFSTPTDGASLASSFASSQNSLSRVDGAEEPATPRTQARRARKKAHVARENSRRITIHKMRYGRQYTEVGSPPAKDILHVTRGGTTWSDI